MENYWEGWGFSDRIPVTISATPRKIEILKLELAKSFPDNQVDELDSRNIRFYAREEQLKKLKKFVATLNGKVYYEKGGEIGEALASSNPYIGGAKVIQGIAPESVSALDKKMASQINPDPNRPIFFNRGGKTPKEKNMINYKKAIEVYIKERYNEDVNWFESMVLFSDKSDETRIKKAVIVTKNGNEYEVYHEDLFDLYKKGGIAQQNKIRKVMHEFKEGELHSSSGQKVTDRKQAIAIALSEAGVSKYSEGGGVDIIAPFGTLVSKNKKQKLEYKKVGSNFEFMIYEGVNNPVSNYSRTSFKKSKNGLIIMNYDEFLKFIYSNGFVDDQKYVKGGGVSKKEPKYFVFEVSYSMRKRGENRNQAGIYKQTITESATTEKGAEREAIKTIRSMHKYENVVFNHIAPKLIKEMTLLEYIESQRPRKYDNGGGIESLKVGDRVYGYFIYNYMGYQLVDSRMGGDLVYGEIKDIITENNQKKYVIKFTNGETKRLSLGILKEYLFVDKKYDNGGSVGQNDYSVAKIILQQLGGQGKLVVMTGANNFVAFSNGVSFKLKSRKANYVKITLNGNDLYDIQFQKLFGMKSKVVAEYNDIYFDQLIPIVEKETGMYLKMFKKGGIVSTQNRDMVISQLKTIHHHEQEMLQTLKNSGEVEAWVLSKVSNASSDLSDVAHYLEFKS